MTEKADIMMENYHWTHEKLRYEIEKIIKDIPNIGVDTWVRYRFDEDDGHTIYDKNHPIGSIRYMPMGVIIGMKSVIENCEGAYVRDRDTVWALWQAYHESDHIIKRSTDFMHADANNDIKQMSRISVIGDCFEEYRQIGYVLDPAELSAESYALRKLEKFFENDDSGIDFKKCVIDIINDGHNGVVGGNANSFEDIKERYDKAFISTMYKKRYGFDFSNDFPESFFGAKIKRFFKSDAYVEILSSDNGLDEANILCKYIAKHEPKCFRGYQCIESEYCKANTAKGIAEKVVSKVVLGIEPISEDDEYNRDEDQDQDDGPDF